MVGTQTLNCRNRPFLKWLGGKYRLVPVLQELLPCADYLVEPFVGAGSVFLNMNYKRTILSDTNADLIEVYRQLKSSSKSFIKRTTELFQPEFNNETTYYDFRSRFNESLCKKERASLFLYLNRHGYNGLCRYNSEGGFNVPFGRYKSPKLPLEAMIHAAKKLNTAKLYNMDYEHLFDNVILSKSLSAASAVIYCDPPYSPLSSTADFTSYDGQQFTEDNHCQLNDWALFLKQQGHTVVISNHDIPFTRKLYAKAKLIELQVTRTVSCNINSRHSVRELLAIYQP